MSGAENLPRLLDIMKALRHPETGCPWDVKQDFKSIAAYVLEEAYEVVDAIERGDMEDLKEELGDLLLQVVFHAQMAAEAGLFDFNDVARAVSDKMIRRHPHVFGDGADRDAEDVRGNWEKIKAEEKLAKNKRPAGSLLDDIPPALPALARAVKLQKRAARIGFDWPEISQVFDKLEEELGELRAEMEAGSENGGAADRLTDEMGDVLFVIANLSRHLKIDPEQAARAGNQKFTRRFRKMEQLAGALNQDMADMPLEALEDLWREAKKPEKTGR